VPIDDGSETAALRGAGQTKVVIPPAHVRTQGGRYGSAPTAGFCPEQGRETTLPAGTRPNPPRRKESRGGPTNHLRHLWDLLVIT